jgi:hypothetical protein
VGRLRGEGRYLEGLVGSYGEDGAYADLCGLTVVGEGCGGEGDQYGWGWRGWDVAGRGVDAEYAEDCDVWGGELDGVDIVGQVGGGGAAEVGCVVGQVEVGEFDAEKKRGQVAGVVDGVALDHAAVEAKGSETRGRTGDGGGRGSVVDDVYWA